MLISKCPISKISTQLVDFSISDSKIKKLLFDIFKKHYLYLGSNNKKIPCFYCFVKIY